MQVVCWKCGTKNRVVEARLHEAKCGACGAPLAPPEPVAIEGARLDKYVAGTEQPVVVDFWADWCGPCKMMAPQFARAAGTMEPRVRFAKLDTEAAQDIAARYAIRSIPTMIVFRHGQEVARQSGAIDANAIVRFVTPFADGAAAA
ncbi:MAG TPA: thioredoxin TrxC [Casimicrobiaceae bacterium]|nr:thioredoxin TrxC [Casimicrobiaceae bacterium]